MAQLSLQYAAGTDAGLKREHNEDCYAAEPAMGLWLVADGVGGHACGEVASDIVRNTVVEQIVAGATLQVAISEAHQAVLAHAREQEASSGMGSTVVALLLQDREYEVAWVGDSRAYIFDTQLGQLSTDHSRVNDLLARNLIAPSQMARHPQRHMLTQSLGISADIEIEPGSVCGVLQPGQKILLCSDGLTEELADDDIAGILRDKSSPADQIEALILAALKAGGSDNVTVVAVGDYPVEASTGAIQAGGDSEDLEITHNRLRRRQDKPSQPAGFPFKVLIALIMAALLALWYLQ